MDDERGRVSLPEEEQWQEVSWGCKAPRYFPRFLFYDFCFSYRAQWFSTTPVFPVPQSEASTYGTVLNNHIALGFMMDVAHVNAEL